MHKNAIILAAGKSSRFAPFTYEKPKGLLCVKGEVLIERQIERVLVKKNKIVQTIKSMRVKR